MANRAYLLAVDDRSTTWPAEPERQVLAEGIDELPVFWASLFMASDLQADQYDDGSEVIEIVNPCVEVETAKARLAALTPEVVKLFDERTAKLWDQWVAFIGRQSFRFLKTSAVEVWGLDPDSYADYWDTLLRAFAQPDQDSLRSAFERNELRLVGKEVRGADDEAFACKLAGAEHILNLPWLD